MPAAASTKTAPTSTTATSPAVVEAPAAPPVVEPVAPAAPERTLAIVTYDVFSWLEPKVGKPGEFTHFRAFQGQPVRVHQEVLERGLSYGAIALPKDAPEVRAQVEALAGPVSDDRELMKMSAAELVAYVTQNPTEAARVHGFEAANQARGDVLRASSEDGGQVIQGPQVAGVGGQIASLDGPHQS